MKFTQVTLSYLRSPNVAHPELPRHCTNFYLETKRWRLGKHGGVVTHEGEVLGFIVNQLPDNLPSDQVLNDSFTSAKMRLPQFKCWQNYDVIHCTIHGRFAFWLVNPAHQDYLALPTLGES